MLRTELVVGVGKVITQAEVDALSKAVTAMVNPTSIINIGSHAVTITFESGDE